MRGAGAGSAGGGGVETGSSEGVAGESDNPRKTFFTIRVGARKKQINSPIDEGG